MSITSLANPSVADSVPINSIGNTTRLSSAAKEFESVLLGQWLKDAESTFGSVPGSEESDAGGEQMKEFAMQHVAKDLADRGGIGIAPVVERALAKEETSPVSQKRGEGY